MGALGAHHPDVQRLRVLLRDASTRRASGRVVLEGPRVLLGALERGARVAAVYVDVDARGDGREAAEAAAAAATAAGCDVRRLAAGVADRVADVRTSSGMLALAERPRVDAAAVLARATLLLVVARVNDPGNLGTLVRAAEAAGADAMVVGRGSVDPYNPKVVRASAGAIFGIPVVELVEDDAAMVLEQLATRGVRRVGAAVQSGTPLDEALLGEPLAIVVGHETRGLGALGALPLDDLVTIPMAGAAESLNVAMAGTVLLFEAARRRRAQGRA